MTDTKQPAAFVTVTCLNWIPVLQADRLKEVVIDSLRFLVQEKRIRVDAFAIMPNHFHLIWQMLGDHLQHDVQRDFLRFTGQQILKHLRNENSPLLQRLRVDAKDRKHQVWERNSLVVHLWSREVFNQKLEYIHDNPVKAGLCNLPEEYKYSSAQYYEENVRTWSFLTHYDD